MDRIRIALAAGLACLGLSSASPSAALEVTVAAPSALEATAERIRTADRQPLVDALGRAGLAPPPQVHITLVPEEHPLARGTPRWVVGQARGQDVVIFPARIGAYPYGSLEAVVGHELVHVALFEQTDGRRLPRWFHEGVAVTVEREWDLTSQIRLVLATAGEPGLEDLGRLFGSDAQPDTARAYLLAAALVADLRQRYGASLPGRIAGHVADGIPFAVAFGRETGETPEAAAARTWRAYRRWTSWIPVVASGASVWSGILVLAFVAFLVRLHRRARRRRKWDEEEDDEPVNPRPAPP